MYKIIIKLNFFFFLFFKRILVRLGGLACGIVTKTVHKTLPGGSGVEGF